jgi:heavy metal efflux system protein
MEFFVPLKPAAEWRKKLTKDQLTDELSGKLSTEFPGVVFNFSQNIEDNVEEALSGVKGENTVKIVGQDLKNDEALGQKILSVLKTVRGIEDLGMFASLGQPNVKIVPDRALCARYGLNVGDVDAVVQAAVGGQAVTQVFEGEKRFDLVVRWLAPYRGSIERIKEILVAAPDGTNVPLGQIADVQEENGPALIYREANERYVPVKFSVRNRDLAGTIAEAQAKIRAQIPDTHATHLEWAGEINQLNEAVKRLYLIIPLTLALIALLVYASVRSWRDMLLVLCNIPIGCIGGILALLVARINFSISAAMGFISIFGIAIQDGLLVVSYAQRLWTQGNGLEEGILRANQRRLRSVLMTTLVAMLGLFPAALSTAIGSQTQKPLAVVVIGGALMLAFLPRLLLPPLLLLVHRGQAHLTTPSQPTGEAIQV